MTWPAVLLWIAFVMSAFSRGPALLYIFVISSSLGSLQMLPSELVGGANLLPQPACALFLIGKILVQPGNLSRGFDAATDFRRTGLLIAFLVYSVASAFVLPRLFADRVELFSVSSASAGLTELQPSFANLTQSCYMIVTVMTVLAVSLVGGVADFRRHFLTAILIGGVVVILSGVIDLVTFEVGASYLLDPFRTASYTLLTDAETLGSKRVVGLMPEASSYGSMCVYYLTLLALLRPCFSPAWRRTFVPLTMAGLFAMAALSTSSAAYVGLCLFVAVWSVNWCLRATSRNALARRSLRTEALFLIVCAMTCVCVYVISPGVFDPAVNLINSAIFDKTASSSYIERSSWTAAGLTSIFATHWLGTGLGSIRVSNWFVSIVSSTGALGSILLFGFVLKSLLVRTRSPNSFEREWRRGLRLSFIPFFSMMALIGTMPDFGVALGALFGLLVCDFEKRSGTQECNIKPMVEHAFGRS